MKTGIIYSATSKTTGKMYIGQTVRMLRDRKYAHKRMAKKSSSHFSLAIRKYGWDDFTWSILYKNIIASQLDLFEKCAIYIYDTYNNGYNSTTGGKKYLPKKIKGSSVGDGKKYPSPLKGRPSPLKGRPSPQKGKKIMPASSKIVIAEKLRMRGPKNKFKGVYFIKSRNKWRVDMTYNRKKINVGYFDTQEEAALAYNKKAIELYGKGNCYLNGV